MKNVETDDLKVGEILVVNCPTPSINEGGSIISQFISSASGLNKFNGYIVGIIAIDLPYAVIVPFYDSTGVKIKGTPLAVNVSNIRFAKPSQAFVSIMSQNKMNSLTFDATEYKGVQVNNDLISDTAANDIGDGGNDSDFIDDAGGGDQNDDPYSDDI